MDGVKDDPTLIAQESAIVGWSDIKRALPRIAQNLGTTPDNLEIMDYFSFPNEYMGTSLRDRPYLTEGHLDGLPFVKRQRLNAKRPMGWGHVYFKSGLSPDIKYCLYIQQGSYGDDIYLIVEKGKLFQLTRNAWKLTKVASKSAIKPVLAEGILEDVETSTIGFIKNAKAIEKYGVKIKRGILLDGPPGNGKTMLCRYIQKLCSQNGIRWGTVTAADIDKAYSERELHDLFQRWTVTFFDDIDVGYMNRKQGNGRMACALLTAMDGVIEADHIVRIFTTNEKVEDLDPAFVRPGRIDRCIRIDKPTKELREQLVKTVWPQEIVENIDVERLIGESDGFSFAEVEAIRSFLVTNKVVNDMGWDLEQALAEFEERKAEEKQMMGLGKQKKKKKYKNKRKVAQQPWHEQHPTEDEGWKQERY